MVAKKKMFITNNRLFKIILKIVIPLSREQIRESNKKEYNAYQKTMLITAIFFLGLTYSFTFSIDAYFLGKQSILIADSIAFFILSITYLFFRKYGKIQFTSYILTILTTIIFLFLLADGGITGFAFMWSFGIPVIYTLFLGSKKGSILAFAYLFLAELIFIIPALNFHQKGYDRDMIINFTGLYVAIYALCLFFEYSQKQAISALRKQNNQMILVIEELNQTKRQFKKEHDQLKIIFESSTTGIAFLKDGRKVATANKKLCQILGYTHSEIVNQYVDKMHLSKEASLKFGEKYYDSLEHGEVLDVEIQLKRKDGKAIWCCLSGAAVNPENLKDGVIWILDDITKKKSNQEKLLVLERKTAILAMIVTANHEINQPLTAVLGNLTMLEMTLEDRQLTKEQEVFIERIKNAIERIDNILKKYKNAESVEIGNYIDDVKMVMFPEKYGKKAPATKGGEFNC